MPTWREYNATPGDNSSPPPVGAPEGGFLGKFVNDCLRYMAAVIRDLGNTTLKLPNNPTASGFSEGAESRAGTMALQQAASVQITGGIITNTAGVLPIRSIIMFGGTLQQATDQAQYGFAICDGRTQNNITTPDLRDRFVRGASSGAGAGATGGGSSTTTSSSGAHTHTVTVAAGGDHDHGGFTGQANASGSGGTGLASGGTVHRHTIAASGTHTHTATTASDGAHTHTVNPLPAYYAVIYLMRVA